MKTRDFDLEYFYVENIFKSLNGFHLLWIAISPPMIFANNEDHDKSLLLHNNKSSIQQNIFKNL